MTAASVDHQLTSGTTGPTGRGQDKMAGFKPSNSLLSTTVVAITKGQSVN